MRRSPTGEHPDAESSGEQEIGVEVAERAQRKGSSAQSGEADEENQADNAAGVFQDGS